MKKIISILASLSLISAMSITTYAYDEPTREELFGASEEILSTLDNNELERLEEMYYTHSENSSELQLNSQRSNASSVSTEYTLEQSGINLALSYSYKGAVWVTRDGETLGYDHGHAALIYTVASWDKSSIEHRGSGSTNPSTWLTAYSTVYNLEGDTYWQNVHTLKVYDVSNTANGATDHESMYCAADYAYYNLQGLSYAPLALKDNVTNVNCATLVYKAYAEQNYGGNSIELGSASSVTVIPKDLVEDEKLILKMAFQWPGSHTWDLS